jgi:hypothetical protein
MIMNDLQVTLWTRSASSSYWVIERSFPLFYVTSALGLPEQQGAEVEGDHGRKVAWFPQGLDPNAPLLGIQR